MDPTQDTPPAGAPEDPAATTKTVEVAPPVTQPDQKLLAEERLQIELLFTQLQNSQLQLQLLDAQKNQIIGSMREQQQAMEAYRAMLSAKYGVDIGRTTVAPNGTIKGPPLPKA